MFHVLLKVVLLDLAQCLLDVSFILWLIIRGTYASTSPSGLFAKYFDTWFYFGCDATFLLDGFKVLLKLILLLLLSSNHIIQSDSCLQSI